MTIQLEFYDIDLTKSRLSRAQCEQLITLLFRDHPEVATVALRPLPGGQMGQSAMTVLLGLPRSATNVEFNPLVIRIGSRILLNEEKKGYQLLIRDLIDSNHAQPRSYAEIDDVAAISYQYLQEQHKASPPDTLYTVLFDDNRDLDRMNQAIETLFRETLGTSKRHNAWYTDAATHPDQRPIWFYNQILPASAQLTLAAEAVSAEVSLSDLVALADRREGVTLQERTVAIKAGGAYSTIAIVESRQLLTEDAVQLRLYVLEGPDTPHNLRQPPRPVAARLDLRVPAAMAVQIQDQLNSTGLIARIDQVRYARLRNHCDRFPALIERFEGDGLRFGASTLRNPLNVYADLLQARQTFTTSIIHGDLNLGNVLLSKGAPNSNTPYIPWLIDFDKTGAGGHTVFDAVKLELSYRLHVLPYKLRTIDEFITLELALHQALIDPLGQLHGIKESLNLWEAYHVIGNIRRIFLWKIRKASPYEYYLGLLAYGLAALKYADLYGPDPNAGSGAYEYVRPRAAVAFLSASCAATLLPDIVHVRLSEHCYPTLERTVRSLIKEPALRCREKPCHEAQQYLSEGGCAIQISGPIGSGREAFAQFLAAKEQRAGAIVPTWSVQANNQLTADDLLKQLYLQLQNHGVQQPISWSDLPNDRDGAIQRSYKIKEVCQFIAAAIEAHPVRSVILLNLGSGGQELEMVATQLNGHLRTRPLIVIVNHQIDGFEGLHIELTLFNEEQVRLFLEQSSPPVFDQAAATMLYNLSSGLIGVMVKLLDKARSLARDTRSLSKALADPLFQRGTEPYLERVVSQLSATSRRLLVIKGALAFRQIGAFPTDRDALTRHAMLGLGLIRTLAEAPAIEQQLEQEVDDPGLRTRLAEAALKSEIVATRPILQALADACRELPTPDHQIRAACLAEINSWREAAESLAAMADNPATPIGAQAESLHTLCVMVIDKTAGSYQEQLQELAGDCMAALGQFRRAAEHYTDALTLIDEQSDRGLRVQVQLLRALDEIGDDEQIDRYSRRLMRNAGPDSPPYAFGAFYRAGVIADDNPVEAERLRASAAAILEREALLEGPRQRLYQLLLARCLDEQARAAFNAGDYAQAQQLIRAQWSLAKTLADNGLTARSLNNLGSILITRGHPDDLDSARRHFEQAIKIREGIGDRLGQLRSGQNLAMVDTILATNAADWEKIEERYQQLEPLIDRVDANSRRLLLANWMEVMIRRGAFDRAIKLFETTINQPEIDAETTTLFWINRAWIAWWEYAATDFADALTAATAVRGAQGRAFDRLELLELAFLGRLRFSPTEVGRLELPPRQADESQRAAYIDLIHGLSALASGDAAGALDSLQTSVEGYRRCPYRAGSTLTWLARAQLQANDPAARATIERAVNTLKPFGSIPAHAEALDVQRKVVHQ